MHHIRRLLLQCFLGILLADVVLASAVAWRAERRALKTFWSGNIDAAIIFYGSDGADTDARIDTAIAAWRSGRVRALIFVGGCRPGRTVSGAAMMAAAAERQGVAPAAVFADVGSYSTQTNLAGAIEIMRTHGLRTVAFVSDPLHLERIQRLAKSNAALNSAASGRQIASGYGGGPLKILHRANYETGVLALESVFGPQTVDRLARAGRVGNPRAETAMTCTVAPRL
jgi:uncharacterized SAM-binding protein YcdF (DUF218 family)